MQMVSKTLPVSIRVQKGLKVIEESRYHFKPLWGEGQTMTVLDEETVQLPLVKRKALAIKKVLSEMPVEIREGELIVGLSSQGNVGRVQPFPEYATQEEEDAAERKFIGTRSVFGHIEPYHPKHLRLGLGGIRRIAEDKLAEVKRKGTGPEKETWYESVLISLDGLQNLIQRHRDLASTLADSEADTKRKEELHEIAGVCRNLLERSPQTFREALQAFWFTHIAVFSAMNRLAFGRFDQNLWPYLKRDLENGVITINEAQELVDSLWLKFCDLLQASQIQEEEGTFVGSRKVTDTREGGRVRRMLLGGKTGVDRLIVDLSSSQQFLQSITLGGLTPEGQDGTNPLTYLCLNTLFRLKLPQPAVYVRLHDESPPELYERVADCIRAGCIGPTIYNDEIIIPCLTKIGIPVEDARDYTSDGCWEVHIQGRTNFTHAIINGAETLDRVLSPARWEEVEVPLYIEKDDPFRNSKTPDPYSFRSFDEVMDSVKGKIDKYIKGYIEAMEKRRHRYLYDIAPLPLLSAFVEGPLESGKDITQGGMEYTFTMPEMAGLSHVADSLAVIKKLCFEEKTIKWSELLDAIRNNWQGKEYLRQMVRTRAPAYGNDIDYVDDIAREIVEFYAGSVRRHSARVPSNVKYIAGLATFELYIALGRLIGATPDGRLAGEPLGTNASPSTGRALSGQTAAVNSYVKLPLIDLPGGSILDLNIYPRADLLLQLESFIKSFVDKRGTLVNIAVTDCEKLRAAQKEPEKYRDLKVRVAGFDAYFTDLPPAHQELQIKRCEQYA